MNRKLTLSLDDSVIMRAKKYAEEHDESLSGIVENYFRLITSEYKGEEREEISPLVEELLGSVNVPEDFDYAREKLAYLEQKHLHD